MVVLAVAQGHCSVLCGLRYLRDLVEAAPPQISSKIINCTYNNHSLGVGLNLGQLLSQAKQRPAFKSTQQKNEGATSYS